MNPALRGVLGVLGAVAVLALVRLGSFIPYTAERDVGAIVRLAWRARGQPVRECRELTPQELERLPVHMREKEVCEGRLLPYRLVVAVDGAQLVDRLVHGAGAREDRPLYVYEDLVVQPGRHRVVIGFTLAASPPAHQEEGDARQAEEHGERREADAHAEPRQAATPPRLALDTTLQLGSRRILLVTYDEEREQLVVRGGSGGS